MNFLEAKRLLDGFRGGPELEFLFGLSGSGEPFEMYLRAAAAKHGRTAVPRILPFNTLAQTLRGEQRGNTEVFLLLPWDFAPELDWRSGVPEHAEEVGLRKSAVEFSQLLARRNARLLYLPAPVPPVLRSDEENAAFALTLQSIAVGLGARLVPGDWFSLSGYFASGCPVGGGNIGKLAEAAVELVLGSPPHPKKVLVTDLDNVVWSGGIGEDGLEGIAFGQQGPGFPHFLYQGLLRRLKSEGTLLAAVSRNDAEVALSPFRAGGMTLREDDFVAIIASYHAKSAQITQLASQLNLGLDAFVFVDDNPLELTEVALALPSVHCVQFPLKADALPDFLSSLATLFARREVTAEDLARTELYRRRLEGMIPSSLNGADITRFLRELGMTLTIHDRSQGDRARAVQLINKTNQFNLNGRRLTEADVAGVLNAGGHLYGASLSDRSGSHGEILACLVTSNRVISAFVMSCRVFQRRVEHAFFAWLATQADPPLAMDWERTPRNEPFGQFLRELNGGSEPPNGMVSVSPPDAAERFAKDLKLFDVVAPGVNVV